MTAAERYEPILVSDPADVEAAQASKARAATASLHDVEALVPAYSTLLFRVAYAVLHNPAEAEDVVQDTFLRVLAHRSKLLDVRDMRVWLVRIAWRLAIDRHKRITPSQMDEVFAQALVGRNLPADQALAEADQVEQVLREIYLLPRREREALLLCAVDEMTLQECAAVLGRSDSAVRALLFRARERLKQRLANAQARRRP